MSLTRRHLALGAAAAGLVAAAVPRIAVPAIAATPQERPKRESAMLDVIVLGAGVSGLNTAWLLEQEGLKVAVLEGRQRVGGRVHTLFDQPGHPEMGFGAMFSGYGRGLSAAKRAGVEMVDIRNRMSGGDDPVLVLGGQIIERADWAASPANPFPAAHKAVMPWELFPRLLAQNNPLKDWSRWMEPSSAPLDISVHEFLKAHGLNDAAIRLAFDTSPYYGTNSYDVSALMYEANEGWAKVVMSIPGTFAVKGGNEQLPRAMARQLKGNVLLGKEVIGIDNATDAVTATCADGSSFRAKRAVSTLPFSTLRNVRIHPPLEGTQAQAVMTLPYQPLSLAFLTVTSPFWEEENRGPGMWTDGRLGVVNAQHFGATPAEVTGLLVWARGNLAHYWDRMGKEAALKMIVQQIETIRPAARGKIAGAALHSWTGERFNAGDFSYFAPGQLTTIVDTMAKPHGRLHFAGEHTAKSNRGLESAFESSERVAIEVASA
jgi:monoamine oxidase